MKMEWKVRFDEKRQKREMSNDTGRGDVLIAEFNNSFYFALGLL